ncbi:BMY1 [Symbiodinium sp. CCMP2456]|nr:BMY1 [Symbiodinium sp. CCMP2456]
MEFPKSGWHKAGYVAVCLVNVIAAAVLFHREADLNCHAKLHSPNVKNYSFWCLQLASCGAGCAAVFLGKRAGASDQGRTACAIGIINWLESLVASMALSLKTLHCRWPGLPEAFDPIILCSLLVLFGACAFAINVAIRHRLKCLQQTSQRHCCFCCLSSLRAVAFGAPTAFVVVSWLVGSKLGKTEGSFIQMVVELVQLAWGCRLVMGALAVGAFARAFWLLHGVLRLADVSDMPATARSHLIRARRLVALQVVGLSFSLVLTALAFPAILTSCLLYTSVFQMTARHRFDLWFSIGRFEAGFSSEPMGGPIYRPSMLVLLQAADVLANAIATLLLSGSHRVVSESRKSSCTCPSAVADEHDPKTLAVESEWGPEWKAKVEELSLRGMTLCSLLDFYQEHLCAMPDWQYVPAEHKTRDVVRRSIIPLTSTGECAYAASALNRDGARRPHVMVTHSWGNCFRDLLAAIISDALKENSFGLAANLLEEDPAFLREILASCSCLDDTYWICAFAVNQHMSICHSNPYDRDPLTNELHRVCHCSCVNIIDPDGRSSSSEINKFDDMMYHLSSVGGCRQVIAVDQACDLFQRAWCVAEIAEAKRLRLNQVLKLKSRATVRQHEHALQNLDVRSMNASSETDKALILNKIAQTNRIDQFNKELQLLILDPKTGLLASWHAMDSLQQIAEAGRLIRWGLADAGTGKVWKAWETHE